MCYFGRPMWYFGRPMCYFGRHMCYFGRHMWYFGRHTCYFGRPMWCFGRPMCYFEGSTEKKTLLSVLDRLRATYKVLCTYHIHSSAKSSPCLDLSKHGFQTNLIGEGRSDKDTVITWIWKDCKLTKETFDLLNAQVYRLKWLIILCCYCCMQFPLSPNT